MVAEAEALRISFRLTEDGARAGKASGNSFTAASSGATSTSSSSASVGRDSGLVIWSRTSANPRTFFGERPFTVTSGERIAADDGDDGFERRSDEKVPDKMKEPRRLCFSVGEACVEDCDSIGELSTTSPALGVLALLPATLPAGEAALLDDPSCKMRESLLRLEDFEGVVGSIVDGVW